MGSRCLKRLPKSTAFCLRQTVGLAAPRTPQSGLSQPQAHDFCLDPSPLKKTPAASWLAPRRPRPIARSGFRVGGMFGKGTLLSPCSHHTHTHTHALKDLWWRSKVLDCERSQIMSCLRPWHFGSGRKPRNQACVYSPATHKSCAALPTLLGFSSCLADTSIGATQGPM